MLHFCVNCTIPWIYYTQKMADNAQCVRHSADNPSRCHQIHRKSLWGGAPSCPCNACDVLWEQDGLNVILCCNADPIEITTPKHSSTQAMPLEGSQEVAPSSAVTAAMGSNYMWARGRSWGCNRSCQWHRWRSWCQWENPRWCRKWGLQWARGQGSR